jgi:GNAT superfamily N-acetyltransferase
MINLKITHYSFEDNEAALQLEEQCVQGEKLILKFSRPSFHARSEVYDKYKILCGRVNDKLIGIIAGAEKSVFLHGEMIRAVYIYDLRVHPDYRKYGTAKKLTNALIEDIGRKADCIYTLMAGENKRALALARLMIRVKTIIPLTYAIIPVYKRLKETETIYTASASEIHKTYLTINNSLQFVPEFAEKRLLGYIRSISFGKEKNYGCSIWTNENLLEERIVGVPYKFHIIRAFTNALRPFINLPNIPKQNEVIKSWFLFDFCAINKKSVQGILTAVNNIAFDHNKHFLYILLRSDDVMLTFIRNAGFRTFTVPYFFLAKGTTLPSATEKIYIDVRDL